VFTAKAQVHTCETNVKQKQNTNKIVLFAFNFH